MVVTGGAGFIGSHLCEVLLDSGYRVRVLDNLSTGHRESLEACISREGFDLVVLDLVRDNLDGALEGCEAVFHLAANPDVRTALIDTGVDVQQNVVATYRLLEAMRESGITLLLFTSTAAVYGDTEVTPTPEDNSPMEPISLYGATKLASEALISSYCHTFGLEASVFRFANVVGARSTHGVAYDLVEKLRRNPTELEVLGRKPGTRKSYCYVDDCIAGLVAGMEAATRPFDVFNIGSEDQITVEEVADAVCDVMGLTGVDYRWTGGVDGGRGWKGDVLDMWLDVSKLMTSGWRPKYTSGEAIRQAVREAMALDRS